MKRLIDIIFSLLALVLLIPIFIPVIIILKFTGEGYVFYWQNRVGVNQKTIKILKFATMLKDSPALGSGYVTVKNDSRVFPFGQFLRKTKINELPQFINLLKGDITLVGRRPTVLSHFNMYSNDIKNIIGVLKPGLTGIGSLIFRNEEEIISQNAGCNPKSFFENQIMPYKGEVEKWYSQNISFWVDTKIVIGTFIAVLFPSYRGYLYWFKDLPKHKYFMT